MHKTLTYSTFAATSLLVILAFVTAQTYTQLIIAIILYPLLVYFAFKLFVSKNHKEPAIEVQLSSAKPAKKVEEEPVKAEREEVGIADIDKRTFLKLIGAAGVSFFLFSIFNRRFEPLFFGKGSGSGISTLEDSTGNKINPAERQPTDSYLISEIDDSYISFYGFTNKEGAWFIMKEDPDNGSFRYTKGESNFSDNWANREHLTYDYYHNVFK